MNDFPFDPYHRRTIRLKCYDYSQPGAYFVTLVAYQRESLFGNINGGVMDINAYGQCVVLFWRDLINHFSNITLDSFVVMPNHLHGIIIKDPNMDHTRAGHRPAPTKNHSLSEIVRALNHFHPTK